jgi:hypothetical protein
MRAIKIDVIAKTIEEIDIDGSLKSMYEALDVDVVASVRIARGEILWVDDNGLHRDPPLGAFMFGVYPQALSGHGLIVGLGGIGDNCNTKLTLEEVKANVSFCDVSELPEPIIKVHSWPDQSL